MEEQNLRILTRIYNGERYMPSFLPPHDEVNADNNNTPSGPGFSGFHDYGLGNSTDYDCNDLDPNFIHNYNAWLETEVFNINDKEEDEQNLEEKQPQSFGCDTPIPFTPCPSYINNEQQFTPEELAFEINKLYIQELNSEFKPATLLIPTSPSSTSNNNKKLGEDWKSPSAPKKLTPLFRYNGNESSMTYLRPPLIQQQEQAVEEQRDENWQMQTRDELMSRLFFVEKKFAERWLSGNNAHGNNSVYHLKLFDLFEQELYSSSEYNTSSDDYDENDCLHYNSSYDGDDQREQNVY